MSKAHTELVGVKLFKLCKSCLLIDPLFAPEWYGFSVRFSGSQKTWQYKYYVLDFSMHRKSEAWPVGLTAPRRIRRNVSSAER
jgi:hypothetical protein